MNYNCLVVALEAQEVSADTKYFCAKRMQSLGKYNSYNRNAINNLMHENRNRLNCYKYLKQKIIMCYNLKYY